MNYPVRVLLQGTCIPPAPDGAAISVKREPTPNSGSEPRSVDYRVRQSGSASSQFWA
ncbi:hypothetical protein BDW68DRAFT_172616 [Aspergillus falconensis]